MNENRMLTIGLLAGAIGLLSGATLLANDDAERLERRVDKLEAVAEAQGDLIIELTDAYLVTTEASDE